MKREENEKRENRAEHGSSTCAWQLNQHLTYFSVDRSHSLGRSPHQLECYHCESVSKPSFQSIYCLSRNRFHEQQSWLKMQTTLCLFVII